MIIQIYAIISEEDVLSLIELGVDHIGIVVSETGDRGKGIVSLEKAQKIIATIKNAQKKSSVIVNTVTIAEIERFVSILKMDILHLCSEMSVEKLKDIRKMLEKYKVKLMYAVPVKSEESIKKAAAVSQIVDYIMLDSPGESEQMSGFVGATGKVHDWSISKCIIEAVQVPVILGGGLSPENVQQAITMMHPAGVDAKTSLDLPFSGGRKDIEKVALFVKKTREVSK
jgi:phosphoribosylanthranilate isomerase